MLTCRICLLAIVCAVAASGAERARRGVFMEDIMKTIPFFKPSNDELLPDPNEEQEDPSSSEVFQLQKTLSTRVIRASSSVVLSTVMPSSSINATSSTLLRTLNFTSVVASSAIINSTSPTPILLSTQMASKFNASTTDVKKMSASSLAVVASSFKTQAINLTIVLSSGIAASTSAVRSTATIAASNSFMFTATSHVAGNNLPQLPQEKGYGDEIAKSSVENQRVAKEGNYFYTGVLIPIMSGVSGALIITISILLYKCLRRRKLQKVRYYNGKEKNASDFYRLDQMSLLTDSSSDEE